MAICTNSTIYRQAARSAGSGIVVSENGFRLASDVIQAPDVAFVREERRRELAPDRYCGFGAAGDSIDAPELLPGFSIQVRALFE